jgi:THO complex subunit 1
MARTDEEKQQAIDAKASKLWRTLRIASKSKLSLFDKIDDGNKLDALFEPEADEHKEKAEANGTDENQEQLIKEVTPLAMDQEDKPLIENGLEPAQETVVK